MKVSLLTPDFSANSTARAYIFAKVLKRHYDVEIIGPKFGNAIWGPIRKEESEITFKVFQGSSFPQFILETPKIVKAIKGDIIWINTPYFTSFGIGLLKKFLGRKPVILDMADWEAGFHLSDKKNVTRRFRSLIGNTVRFFRKPNSYWSTLINERITRFAEELTVSNSFLQQKFGGTIIPHCRDTEAFNPERFNKNSIRGKCDIDKNKKIVMFFGTPKPHKGVEDLVKAISLIENQNVVLVIVGIDDKDYYSENLVKMGKEILGNRFRVFGLQPFKKVPEFLAMADVTVVPQKRNVATIGQLPAKVFDAMAMAKPIIATAVSDLPEILDGCGWIVEPENPKQLAQTIKYVLDNPEEAKEVGWKARQKCITNYSWDAMEMILVDIFKKYE